MEVMAHEGGDGFVAGGSEVAVVREEERGGCCFVGFAQWCGKVEYGDAGVASECEKFSSHVVLIAG